MFFNKIKFSKKIGLNTSINYSFFQKNLIKLQKFNFSEKNKKFNSIPNSPDENFFYEKSQISEAQNLISVNKKESKLKSKLSIQEPTEQPLVENEAYRELYKNFSLYIGEHNSRELDEIKHNQEENGKLYKYGLPAKNELAFTELIPAPEEPELPKTSTENLFDLLELDKESSYESLILKIQSEYNHGNFYINL